MKKLTNIEKEYISNKLQSCVYDIAIKNRKEKEIISKALLDNASKEPYFQKYISSLENVLSEELVVNMIYFTIVKDNTEAIQCMIKLDYKNTSMYNKQASISYFNIDINNFSEEYAELIIRLLNLDNIQYLYYKYKPGIEKLDYELSKAYLEFQRADKSLNREKEIEKLIDKLIPCYITTYLDFSDEKFNFLKYGE